MFLFNFKEVIATYSFENYIRISELLRNNEIIFRTRIIDSEGSSPLDNRRAVRGSLGLNQKYAKEYKVYVKKQDFLDAEGLIHKMTRTDI